MSGGSGGSMTRLLLKLKVSVSVASLLKRFTGDKTSNCAVTGSALSLAVSEIAGIDL
jgi:hypothetical protein